VEEEINEGVEEMRMVMATVTTMSVAADCHLSYARLPRRTVPVQSPLHRHLPLRALYYLRGAKASFSVTAGLRR